MYIKVNYMSGSNCPSKLQFFTFWQLHTETGNETSMTFNPILLLI